MNEKNNSQESGNFNQTSSSFSNDEKKQERKEAVEKAGQVAARGAADYFTGGAYEKFRNAPVVGEVAQGAEKVVGKAANVANVASLGTLGRTADKLNKAGALDAADKVVGAMGGKMKGGNTPTTPNVPKNTNPNPEAFSHKSSLDSEIDKPSGRRGILGSAGELFNRGGKGDVSEEITITGDEDVVKKINPVTKIGCLLLLPLAFILSIPVFIVGGAMPVSDTMTETECLIENNNCEEEEVSFLTKFRNLIKYGSFASNSDVISKKVKDEYEKIYNEYEFIIDMPLLIATITVDLDSSEMIEQEDKVLVSEDVMKRLEYIDELAMMQMVEGNTIYLCNSKEVDGEIKYYETVYYGDDEEVTPTASICNAYTVGQYITRVEAKLNAEEYFKALEENVITDVLYPNYADDIATAIGKVKSQYDFYKLLYDNSGDEGNIPTYLMVDEKVNLASPLKGRVTITSPFGDRDGMFAGFHNGIDVISDDKTIYAAGDGVVTRANYEMTGGYVIEITHTDSEGKQYISLYGHIKEGSFLVKVGDVVKSGDPIATMGATGVVNGVHLHFSFWDASTNRDYMNPRNLFTEATNY